jgi:excisionase family DNA binding protein
MKPWVTAQEYADYIGVHVKTVYRAIRTKTLPHRFERIGRTIRIKIPKTDSL